MDHLTLRPRTKYIETLNHRDTAILNKGGQIFLVSADSRTVGWVALIPMQDGLYELSNATLPDMLYSRADVFMTLAL